MTKALTRAQKLPSALSSAIKSTRSINRKASFVAFLFISLVGIVSLGILNVSAFSGTGGGNSSDPYLISSCTELQSIGATENTEDRLYKLTADIDCSATSGWNSGAGFDPLPEFKGTLDGQGYSVTGLTINRPSESEVGLFSGLHDTALVTRLTLDGATINGGNYTGAIASQTNYSIIRDVHVDATVTTSDLFAGGLVGSTFGWENDSIFERVSFTGSVSSGSIAGGILGQGYNGFTLNDVYVDATITSSTTGGIIGQGSQSCGYRYINRALVKGTLNGSTDVGGIAGKYENFSCYVTEISNSVSLATLSGAGNKGTIMGALSGSVVTFANLYYDQTASGTTNCVGSGSGSTGTCGDIGSNVAPSGEPYAQWDFSDVWQESSGIVTLRPTTAETGPSVVTDLAAAEGDPTNMVAISWTAPNSLGSYPLLRYRVEIKEASDSWTDLIDSANDTLTSLTFSNLKLGTEYTIRVTAVTEYSMSEWVEISYTTPDPQVYTANTCEELDELDQQGSYLDTYLLGQDIDCTDYEGFTPLNWGDDFNGIFDGQGHTITELNISAVDDYSVGLMKYAHQADIKNINFVDGSVVVTQDSANCGAVVGAAYDTDLTNITVSGYGISCAQNIGGIVGYYESSMNGLAVERLSSDGVLDAGSDAGGLFGAIEVYAETSFGIHESFSSATVTAADNNAGGLIGEVYVENDDDTAVPATFIVQDSYANGTVGAQNNAGGLIGNAEAYNDGYDSVSEIEVENSYSSANVSATDSSAGGVIGYMDDLEYEGEQVVLNNVFVTGGISANNLDFALIGSSDGISDGLLSVNNSYFDQTNTGQMAPSDYMHGGWTAVNTDGSESDYFKNNSSNDPLDQWDFESVWRENTDNLPTLLWSINLEDLNGDDIPDSDQPNIAGYVSPVTGKIVAFDVGENCEVTTDDIVEESTLSVQDDKYEYKNGLFDFAADCQGPGETTTIKLYYYDVSIEGLELRKFNPNTSTYFKIEGDNVSISQQTINEHSVAVATYQITDGGELDMDGAANGEIEDPAGVGQAASPSDLAKTGRNTLTIAGLALMAIITASALGFRQVISRRR